MKNGNYLRTTPTAAGPSLAFRGVMLGAETLTAGLLVFGCLVPGLFFISLLKCVLARWFLDVSFQVIF